MEYRLGPEHMFPAAMDDGITVIDWVKKNKEQLGRSDKIFTCHGKLLITIMTTHIHKTLRH